MSIIYVSPSGMYEIDSTIIHIVVGGVVSD